MATTVECAVLDSLAGHTTQAGLDLIRYAFRNNKGFAGALRRNRLLPLITRMEAHCDEVLAEVPGYQAATKGGGHCVHCMQDHFIGVRSESRDDDAVFLMTVDNCDYHRFYGRTDCEERLLACRRSLPFSPDRLRNPSSERLPFAIVHLDEKLLGHCMNQRIRQTTKEDTAALADCYAFGVRSMTGLRADVNRAEVLKLHFMAAARLKWAPATIARVYEWVPVLPFNNLAVYQRPHTMRLLAVKDPIDVFLPPPQWAHEYGWNDGVPHWAHQGIQDEEDFLIGPAPQPDFYLPPEDELQQCLVQEGARGANGRRTVERCAASDEDKICRALRERDGQTAKDLGNATGLTTKQANRVLYRLETNGLVLKFGGRKPILWFNTVDSPSEWLTTVRDMDPEMDELSKAWPERVASTWLDTETQNGRDRVQIGDPAENRDLTSTDVARIWCYLGIQLTPLKQWEVST